jgi:hypothetical protein
VRSYLSKPKAPSHGDDGSSIIAMNVKACILLHRSMYLQRQCQWAQERESSMESSRTTFDIIDKLIESLRVKLRLENLPCTPTVVLTYSLLDAATITLHNIFTASDATSRQRCYVLLHRCGLPAAVSKSDHGCKFVHLRIENLPHLSVLCP